MMVDMDNWDFIARQFPGGPGPASQAIPTHTSTSEPLTTPLTSLSINTPSTLTTCQSANITWNFSGSDTTPITLLITDEEIDQSTLATAPPTVLRTLAESTDAISQTWEWSSVNLTSGYYIIIGSVPGISDQQTSPFFIATGSDRSCLSASSSSSSSTHLPTGTSIHPAGSSKHTNVGAIAGGVIGGVAIILIALFALFFLRRRNRVARGRHGSWGGVRATSTDSYAAFTRAGRGTGQNATGGVQPTGGKFDDIGLTIAVASSQDELPFGEDEKFSPTSSSILHNVPPIAYRPSHANRTSVSSRQSDNSVSSAIVHRGVPAVDITDYHRTERSPSVPVLSRPTTNSSRIADLSSAEMIPMGRSSSSQSAVGARRTSRKPVPQYDAAELERQSRTSNVELPSFDFESMQTLNRQSSNGSFGQVHYLIPDMPPPSRD